MLNPFQDLLLSEGLDGNAWMTMLNQMFFGKSAAIRGDFWKRSLIYQYNGRRSELASVKEKNDDLVLGENNKAKKQYASADPIKRIHGERSADPTIRGPRSDPTQEDSQLDTPAPGTSFSARDAALGPLYPGRWLGEKSLGYLRYIDRGVHSKRGPESINRSVHLRDEHRR